MYRVSAVMNALDAPSEMILINDGSRDRSMEMLRQLHQNDSRVKVINFSRNFDTRSPCSPDSTLPTVMPSLRWMPISKTRRS